MIRATTWDEVRATRRKREIPQFQGFVTDFIVADPEAPVRAQAFLVEQNPNWVLPAHFHLEFQFQVFTAGSGSIGAHAVAPLSVHYASPQSGYGPLTAGANGISYFTLRARSDTGAWYLPESRPRMERGLTKQQKRGDPTTLMTEAEICALGSPAIEELIAPQESGLAAYMVRMPADTAIAAPGPARGGGRFYVVTKGSIVMPERTLPALGTVFVSQDERLDLRSGSRGVEVLVLQFPLEAQPATP
jgi:hypothetical protein